MSEEVKENREGEGTSPSLPPCRLFFLLARDAPTGVIFRRGPSRWVQIIKWNTKTDAFEGGHWFKGRIYEKRCDLSPDGTHLIYFAQKIEGRTLHDREYTYAWTAVSKAPWLTALALWPKGDCWHGGGLFPDERTVWLNHRPEAASPHPNHLPPKGVKIIPNPEAAGEDGPVFYRRLERDGWAMEQEWEGRYAGNGFVTDTPGIFERAHPQEPMKLKMTDSIHRFDWRFNFEVMRKRPSAVIPIEGATWADWDHRGRLVYVKEGKLYAARLDGHEEPKPKELADFNAARPEAKDAPSWAKKW